ncbi:pyridoxal-phosphate dependent enzyme [Pseudoxanthomonas kaohsiungensis]|uniref:Pyridoxal-phosphate dependent enzyme n=1 Tax=Pseudoxanthomonas kaohsiungensis TaxID=283923 RepID=A0ABW3LYQ3_9GAMM|nr:pyridoxal-phosphate dependent enzyme [Pseudoxanthomonas kaohsiungensis]KAF1704670.1 serine dehydratase [Pseudoxanthomonas kaohsiungensis]
MPAALPVADDVLAAATRIAGHADLTPVLRSRTLDAMAGCQLLFKAEHLQRGGAFKFRGACNAVWSLSEAEAAHGVVTHSSGNHGAALALAARGRGIACHVVVPEGAVAAKLANIQRHGATLWRCEATQAAREATCAQVQQATGAQLVHPYADARVIAGQGTAALELAGQAGAPDVMVVPVGGGGLAAGTALALAAVAPDCGLVLAEPAGAADTARSLAAGERRIDFVPDTVCDGLRGALGAPNFELLRAAGAGVVVVDDDATIAAMRLAWQVLKQVVEPSSAIALAAVLAEPARFAGKRVGLVLSGGNVDLEALPWRA